MNNAPLREVNGILLLNKPIGLSSNQALTAVKKLFRAKKAGHTGSLDPLAEGMLPICFGEATKLSWVSLEADKEYWVKAKLGIKTATGDAEGAVVAVREVPKLTLDEIETTLNHFRGQIQQVPSMYSALKFQGKPLYTYARKGIEIKRESRTVHIKKIGVNEFTAEELTITVQCSKGTYIRTLIEDIGEMIGCGAYVTSLYRTYVEPYAADQMISLDSLQDHYNQGELAALDNILLPIDSGLMKWPAVTLTDTMAHYMRQGQPLLVPKAPANGSVRLLCKDAFFGVGVVMPDGRIAPKRLVATHK